MSSHKLTHSDLIEYKVSAQRLRRVYERDWMLNMAYLAGYQYVAWNFSASRIVELTKPEGATRMVHNVLLKISRQERAKLLKTMPVPTALPVTDNQDDILTARILSAYYRQLMEEWKFERRLRTGVNWLVTTGNVFFKWVWDSQGKRNQFAVVPPLDIYPDPYARTFIDSRWVIHSQFMSVDEAKERYKTDDVDAVIETRTDTLSPIESQVFSYFGDGEKNLEGVVINEYWEPPNATNEKGRFIVFTENKILLDKPFPYEHGKLPFTHVGHVERPGSKWHRSILDGLRPLQDEVNRVESQIIENRNLANGKWWIPPELELAEMPDASPRQILSGVGGPPGAKPDWIAVDPLPSWVGNEPSRLQQAMEDIAGQHEVSNASVPGRVESGQAIQLLQEQEDSVMRETVQSLEEAISDGFGMSAALLKQYGNPVTDVKVYDKNGMLEEMQLKKDKIPLESRVKTKTTTGLPTTVAGRWDRVLNLWQYKVLTDQNKVLELLDIAPEEPDLVADTQDRKNAFRENREMASGKTRRPKKWDNHQAHREEHYKYMKSEEFRLFDLETQQRFEFHVHEHDQLELQVLQEEANKQMVAQGQQPMAPAAAGQEAQAAVSQDDAAASGDGADSQAMMQQQSDSQAPAPPPTDANGSPPAVA